jgi:multidrug transporter EmrE-like cation transporter
MWWLFIFSFLFQYGSGILSKQFGVSNNWWYAVASIIGSVAASIIWSLLMKKGVSLSTVSPILSVLLVISIVATGVIAYQEPISWTKIAGVLFGIIAIVLIIK